MIPVRTSMIWRPSSYVKLIQPETQPKQTNPQPNPNATVLRIAIVVKTLTAAQEVRPSRWVPKSWNRYFQAVVKELPRAFCLVFFFILWIFKICSLFFLSRSHTISNTYIWPETNPTKKPITRGQYVIRLCSLSGVFTPIFFGKIDKSIRRFLQP